MFGAKRREQARAEVDLLARGFAAAYGPDAELAAQSKMFVSHAGERRVLEAVVRELARWECSPA